MQCSNPASITSTATPYTSSAPGTPGLLTDTGSSAQSSTSASISFSWASVQGATEYYIYDKGSGQTWGPYSGYSATISSLSPDSPLTVALKACNSAGQCTTGQAQTYYTAAYSSPVPATPGAPYWYTGTYLAPGQYSVWIEWNPVSGAEYYNIIHTNSSGATLGTQVSGVYGTNYNVTGLDCSGVINLAIQAVNSSGQASAVGPNTAFQTLSC